MEWRNPTPTVDVVIRQGETIVLIKRANPPHGWALPGGFIDEGERVERAAVREALEETGLDVRLEALLSVYSDPSRDPRQHTMSVVFTATAEGAPEGLDDALEARQVPIQQLRTLLAEEPALLDGLPLAFDHAAILRDYLVFLDTGDRPRPVHTQG
jgi:8-oxo-dGTP diphosphatase